MDSVAANAMSPKVLEVCSEEEAAVAVAEDLPRGGFSRIQKPAVPTFNFAIPPAPKFAVVEHVGDRFEARPMHGVAKQRPLPFNIVCRIVFCISQLEFYILPECSEPLQTRVESLLRSLVRGIQRRPAKEIVENHVYIAKNPKGQFARAWVSLKGGKESSVFFIDHGTFSFVPNGEIFEMPSVLGEVAGPLVYFCGLLGADSRDLVATQVRAFRHQFDRNIRVEMEWTGRQHVHHRRVKHLVSIKKPFYQLKKGREDGLPTEWLNLALQRTKPVSPVGS